MEEARAAAQRAHSAELRDDGIAVVRVGGMVGVAADGPVLVACSHAVAGARALVLDLRADGGGDPSTVRLVLDWVESGRGDRERLVSTVRYPDRVRQWWTSGWFPGAPLADGVPVVALVGPGTYSSGEALAHHLRRSGALLVGERTPGAADHVVPVALLPHVSALVPEAEVRDGDGSTWEGVGVEPDVVVPADEALGAAVIAVGRGRQVTRIHRGHGPARGLEIR